MGECSSDAETVLDEEEREEEDSPMSPCVWTAVSMNESRDQGLRSRVEEATLSVTTNESDTSQVSASPEADASLGPSSQAPRRELLLSPASQLNVLSQISELADVQSRQSTSQSAASRPVGSTRRTHAWAPAAFKRKQDTRSTAASRPMTMKKQKKTQKMPARSQAERLAVDMLDWETCSEGELFEADTDDTQSDWIYEDISDTDFEGCDAPP